MTMDFDYMAANPDGICRPLSFLEDRMAKHIFDQNPSSSWYITESNDTWILTKDQSLSVSSSTAISEDQNQRDNKIIINGVVKVNDVIGTSYAVAIYGTGTDIVVGGSGSLTATNVVALSASHQSLTNHGLIDGEQTAVYMYSDHGVVNNFGTIESSTGINAFGDASKIINQADGEIKSSVNAVYSSDGHKVTLINHGLMEGTTTIMTGNADDRVVNDGRIVGDVSLGDGNDVFDTRGGKLDGTVDGGSGNDTYLVSKAALDINESFLQGGMDTVKSTVSYEINTAIENVTLLGRKNIDATGSDIGNTLTGNRGDNILRGLGGTDILIGGKGNDHLFGGELGDTFVFKTGHGHDIIADFDVNAGDRIDLTGIEAIKNYKDLLSHHLDVAGDDLLIGADGDQIRIRNFGEADIKESMFDFA
jgi:Ca2+-binding RTX toxin-like protein